MPDRVKVIEGLKHCLHYNGSCLDCPYDGPNCQNDVLDDALTLLKEQPDIVRCKDCKYRSEKMYDYYGNPDNKVYVCQIHDLAKKPEWYCADGERSGENERQ